MCMIGCRCTTFRSIVEYHQFRIHRQYLVHLTIIAHDSLHLMTVRRYCVMKRKSEEWIDEYVILVVEHFRTLLDRSVFLTQETGTLGYGAFVYLCSRRHDACRIILGNK